MAGRRVSCERLKREFGKNAQGKRIEGRKQMKTRIKQENGR